MRSNVDVDAEDLPLAAQQLEDAGGKYERSAVGDASLDHEVGLRAPDQLLDDDDVFWMLDDRDTEPAEVVRVTMSRRDRDPLALHPLGLGVGGHGPDSGRVTRAAFGANGLLVA